MAENLWSTKRYCCRLEKYGNFSIKNIFF